MIELTIFDRSRIEGLSPGESFPIEEGVLTITRRENSLDVTLTDNEDSSVVSFPIVGESIEDAVDVDIYFFF
jgi:hypothetical protein